MRDVIVWPGFSRMGFDPTVDLLKDLADAATRYINAWVRKGWDVVDWPELSRTEPRNPTNGFIAYDAGVIMSSSWSQTQTYNQSSVVRDPNNSANIYVSVQNANTGHPLVDLNWWTLIAAWDKTKTYLANNQVCDPVSGIVYVAQQAILPLSVLADSLRNTLAWQPISTQQQSTQTLTNIGRILKVYLADPTIFDGPFDIPFREYDSAFHVGFRHGATVWVKFMSRPNQYTLTVWNPATTYNQYSSTSLISDLAYSPTVGECFASIQPGNTNHPQPTGPTNNAWWSYVPFPFVLAEPVWRGLYSDLLRDAGQTAKAQVEEQAAVEELQLSVARNTMTRYDRITDQQTGVPRYQAAVSAGAE